MTRTAIMRHEVQMPWEEVNKVLHMAPRNIGYNKSSRSGEYYWEC